MTKDAAQRSIRTFYEVVKFDYSDFSMVSGIINRETFSVSNNANGWSYNNLTPERKADYDFMMHM